MEDSAIWPADTKLLVPRFWNVPGEGGCLTRGGGRENLSILSLFPELLVSILVAFSNFQSSLTHNN